MGHLQDESQPALVRVLQSAGLSQQEGEFPSREKERETLVMPWDSVFQLPSSGKRARDRRLKIQRKSMGRSVSGSSDRETSFATISDETCVTYAMKCRAIREKIETFESWNICDRSLTLWRVSLTCAIVYFYFWCLLRLQVFVKSCWYKRRYMEVIWKNKFWNHWPLLKYMYVLK